MRVLQSVYGSPTFHNVANKSMFISCLSIYIYNSVLTCRQNIINSSASAHWTLRKLLWRKLVMLKSACSGWNYNFRCINVVFGVFLRESARTASKSRITLAQIREKLPNGWAVWHQMWHTCAHSYGNGYTPNKLPLERQGGTWQV